MWVTKQTPTLTYYCHRILPFSAQFMLQNQHMYRPTDADMCITHNHYKNNTYQEGTKTHAWCLATHTNTSKSR